MENINLIWQTKEGDQTNFEYEYITEILFKNFKQTKFFDDAKLNIILDNSVIIYSNDSDNISEEFEKYLNKFLEKKYKFYLLHLSNENLGYNYDYYTKANHVFRCYFNKHINANNVTFIPLGIKSGFLSNNQDKKNKEYNFSFIGQPKSDRYELIDIISKLNGYIYTTNEWNCLTALSQIDCKEIYQKTKFAPCPMGWINPDSYRIMESLENGSIPILKRYDNLEYFEKIWGDSPIPIVDEWEEIYKLNDISDDEYELLYTSVMNWYYNLKENLSKKIENNILNCNIKSKKINSLIHFITPLHKKNNIRILYSNIINLIGDFNWHLIEGSNTIGEESLDFLIPDQRVHFYKMETKYVFGHEQRNYFIENIICGDKDWCFFLDDDTTITEDLIETITSENNNDVDLILFSQKKGLTEKIRLYGYEGHLKLGFCDIGSFALRYDIIKKTKIPYESERNSDGHYAEQLINLENIRIKYYPNKYTRYNSLSLEIT